MRGPGLRAVLLPAALVAAAAAVAAVAEAQVVTRRTFVVPDTGRARRDSLRAAQDSVRRDTARVGRGAGVPTTPSRTFPAPDSVLDALLKRPGYRATRYSADSVRLLAESKEIRLAGRGLIQRDGSTLEADTVRYTEPTCTLEAAGSPRLFDPGGNMVGEGMRYDVCNHAGIVENAKTDLVHGGGTWYLRGDVAVDNQEDRVYASHATITSCELIDPHYHFAVREVKWVSKRLMVSRPAVLYVADVPIAWLPFVFQDTRRGRRSGILAPQFGINDIVRFNSGYARHVSNVGYYWAISDFADAQTSLDWYAGRFLSLNGRLRYRWLNRFLAGGLSISEMRETGGTTSRRLAWSHNQQFSLASSLTANLDYVTSSRIISRNAVDPILAVGTIDSRLNYQHRFRGGQLNLGGSRTQSLDKPQVSATFPTVAFTPNPIAVSRAVTWTPSVSFTNNIQQHGGNAVAVIRGPGVFDSLRTDSRTTAFSFSTPLRIGQWNFNNAVSVNDAWSNLRTTQIIIDPLDSSRTSLTRAEDFSTGVDWTTGVGLPVIFQGTWNLQPGVSIVNTAGGPFLLRNTYTGGRYVSQGKRFQFSAGLAPTLFGLFPGFGPIARIRHALSPIVSYQYSPRATIPLEYAQATNRGVVPTTLVQPARQSVTLGLSQNFEAKLHPPRPSGTGRDTAARDTTLTAAGDSVRARTAETGQPADGRKLKLLSLQSDGIGYDFEQAKQPGRTGWTTPTWGNTLSSDLVRGFTLRLSHDLWDGPVGYDTTRFAPMLTSMAFGFSLGPGTINLFRRILGLSPTAVRETPRDTTLAPPSPTNPGRGVNNAFAQGPLATQFTTADRLSPARGGTPFQAQLNYSLQRSRPQPVQGGGFATQPSNSMVTGSIQFSPTPHWTVSWQTSYNFTQSQFADHVVRLDRDLHDWRATFTFVKSPNGNFLFNFFIQLIDEPDLKFAYDQRNVK